MGTLPLKTEADYDRALSEIASYFTNPPPFNTPAATRFNVLTALIESYEAHHWTIEPPGGRFDPALHNRLY